MKSIMFALLGALCLLGQARADAPRYLQVAVSGSSSGSGEPVCPVSLVYDLNQEQLLNGAYYIADSSCGITADASVFQPGGLKFEMAYNMRLRTDDERTWLSGSTYALSYPGGERGGRGERTSVEKELVLGRKTLVGSFVLPDGRDAELFVTLLDHCPPNSTDCGENAVTLITSVSDHGKSFAHRTQVRKLLAEKMNFLTDVDSKEGDGKGSELRYAVMVRIPGGLKALKGPTQCNVTFQRSYQIISRQTNGANSQTAVNYTSQNEREVTLQPGKELRLVFPPDQPPVQGFDIEDTLVIVP